MKNVLAAGLSIFAGFFVSISSALSAECFDTWCDSVQIRRLNVQMDGVYVLMDLITDAQLAPLNCTLPSGTNYMKLVGDGAGQPKHPNFDAVYALLLTAHTTGRTIEWLGIIPNSNPCAISYVTSAQ